ncbi:hypothetical protein IMAU60057_03011 [Lactiplantibacillus plantarum]|nr:hypothetical protein [Lactiplantibacillus plantarum]
MSTEKIDLHSAQYKGTSLPLGYERGNILSIKYETDNIPNNERLVEDLLSMKSLLTELEKSLFSPNNLEFSISYIMRANELGENEPNYVVQKRNQNIIEDTTGISQTPVPKARLPKSSKSVKVFKKDYEDNERTNSRIGFSGEILVLRFEKKRLKEANRYDLSKKVEQVSCTQGDGLGYDIVSYTDMGDPIYIEVKTTKGGINTPFYISKNELEASKKYGDSYKLYRVYNIADDCRFYVVTGDLSNELELSAQSYKAIPW